MNMHSDHKKVMQVSTLALVLLLSGCEWWGAKKEAASPAGASKEVAAGDVVIATMAGKPILTLKQFEERFEQLLAGQPQLRAMLQYMPDLKVDVAKSLVSQDIINKFVEESGVNKQADYLKDLELARAQAQNIVNVKHFRVACTKPVAEADVRKYYDEHKGEHPELLASQGGIPAASVSFEKEADAKAFMAKVTGKGIEDLKKAADAAKLGAKFKDYKFVNAQSFGIDPVLRDKIVAIKKPGLELIKVNDKSFFVVGAGTKEESKYRPFEEVKEGLSKFLANKAMEESMEAKLDELKKTYNVTINEDLLRPKQEEKAGEVKAASNEAIDANQLQKTEQASANAKTA